MLLTLLNKGIKESKQDKKDEKDRRPMFTQKESASFKNYCLKPISRMGTFQFVQYPRALPTQQTFLRRRRTLKVFATAMAWNQIILLIAVVSSFAVLGEPIRFI